VFLVTAGIKFPFHLSINAQLHISIPRSRLTVCSLVFTRESSYCFQRVLAIAIVSVRPSVSLSVTRVDQSKTVQARIKSSPSAV